jgi:hypothetical protein
VNATPVKDERNDFGFPKNGFSSSVGSDESMDASHGGSISSVRTFISGLHVRDWLFVCLLILITGFYIYDRGKLQSELSQSTLANAKLSEDLRANTVAIDLAKYNAQEVRIQTEVNKQLMAALACKR